MNAHGRQLRLGPVIRELVRQLQERPDALVEDLSCELCNDVDWWLENGYTLQERYAFCGPSGLDCPGIEPPPSED